MTNKPVSYYQFEQYLKLVFWVRKKTNLFYTFLIYLREIQNKETFTYEQLIRLIHYSIKNQTPNEEPILEEGILIKYL